MSPRDLALARVGAIDLHRDLVEQMDQDCLQVPAAVVKTAGRS